MDFRRHRGRVADIAGKHLHRHRTAVARAQHAEGDLLLAAFAVAAVSVRRQRAPLALEPGRRDVIQHQRPFLQVALGQAPLDVAVALPEPVQSLIQVVFVHRTEPERFGQRTQGARAQPAGRGQLGFRIEDARRDQGHRQIAHAAALGGENRFQTAVVQAAEHRGDMAVGFGAHDVEGLVQVLFLSEKQHRNCYSRLRCATTAM